MHYRQKKNSVHKTTYVLVNFIYFVHIGTHALPYYYFNAEAMVFFIKECDNKSVLCVNEGSFVGLIASKFAKKVAVVEPNAHFRSALHAYRGHNTIENVQLLANEEEFFGEVSELKFWNGSIKASLFSNMAFLIIFIAWALSISSTKRRWPNFFIAKES